MLAAWLVFVAGCGFTPVDMLSGWDLDSDGDGLCDADEVALGTDLDDPDTDGDGHADGEEAEAGTDPLDEGDYPYTGGYPIDADCRDDLVATGNGEGDVTDDFALTDQFGDTVHLHDFCAHAVLLVSAAFW